MPLFPATAIRLPLSVVSEPANGLIDQNTGVRPAFFIGANLEIDFAVFDEFSNIVDLSNIALVEADLVDDPDKGNILARTTIVGSALAAVIPIFNWRNATQAQGTITFTADQLASLKCFSQVFLVVRALTTSGVTLIWGGGTVSVKSSGVLSGVYMPLLPAPTIIPKGAIYFIPAGVTITFPVSPQIIGELILQPATGNLPAGAMIITSA